MTTARTFAGSLSSAASSASLTNAVSQSGGAGAPGAPPTQQSTAPLTSATAADWTLPSAPEPAQPELLPTSVILGLPVTQESFSDIDQFKETGPNTLATGIPYYSRQIIYNNSFDDSLRVTYAVDVYVDAASAHAGYQEAVDKSLIADGFHPLPDPGIGEESFAGTSGDGPQRHVGVGARVGNIVVGVTRAGYDADQQTIDKVFALTRLQLWRAAILVPFYTAMGWFEL